VERSPTDGELGEPSDASRFLFDNIAFMMRRGERRRLLLSNFAADAYGVVRSGSFNDYPDCEVCGIGWVCENHPNVHSTQSWVASAERGCTVSSFAQTVSNSLTLVRLSKNRLININADLSLKSCAGCTVSGSSVAERCPRAALCLQSMPVDAPSSG
jgi:hypothetical protein